MSLTLNATKILAVSGALLLLLAIAVVRTATVSAEPAADHALLTLTAPVLPAFTLDDLLPARARLAHAPTVQVTAETTVHGGPGSRYLPVGAAEPGEWYKLLGKSPDGRWWRIDFGGYAAWLPTTATQPTAAAAPAPLTP
jgi:uncharacterized protein YraI